VETAAQITGQRNFGLRSVADWRFDDPAPIAGALRADAVLLVVVLNTRYTLGRQLQGLVGAYTPWHALCAACLVDLADGRLVWCDARADRWPDLRDPAVAAAAVSALLGGVDAVLAPPTRP
jgi:hypothetical protein